MAFPTLSPRNTTPYDKFLSLLDGTPLTTTTTGDPILLDTTALSLARCIVGSSGYTGYAPGTAEWSVEVQVSDAIDGTYVPFPSLTIPGNAGNYSFGISGESVYKLLPTARYVRAVATLTGTAGEVTLQVYLGA
jgi:hypothetical protein